MQPSAGGFNQDVLTSAARTCEAARQLPEKVCRARAARADRRAPSRVDELEASLNDARCKIENLQVALRTARQIGIALGIVMARHGFSEEEAFKAIRGVSQHRHVKLRDIAAEVVLTGALAV